MSEIRTAEQYLVQRVMDLEEENDALAEAVEDLEDALELTRCHEASLEEELDGMAAQLRARADYDEVCEQRDRYADLWEGVKAILDLVQEWLDWPGGLTLSDWLDRRLAECEMTPDELLADVTGGGDGVGSVRDLKPQWLTKLEKSKTCGDCEHFMHIGKGMSCVSFCGAQCWFYDVEEIKHPVVFKLTGKDTKVCDDFKERAE